MPSRYPVEVRKQVVELARSGTRVAQLAETFGMSEAVIYGWLKQGRIDRGEAPALSTEGQMELRYGRGIHVGKEQVHLLMRRLGIYGLPKRRLPRGARVGKASSLDLVRRRFTAEGPLTGCG